MRTLDRAALLLIDLVNPLAFEGADALLEQALPAVERIAALRARARAAGAPCIFVNDNFGSWHLGFRELVEEVRGSPAGRRLLGGLEPDPRSDFFVLKPMHSGFFQTALETLLVRLRTRTLVLTGIAGDICVLFTANDAQMRGFELVVPSDCVASERSDDNRRALAQMERLLHADVRPSRELAFRPAPTPPDPCRVRETPMRAARGAADDRDRSRGL